MQEFELTVKITKYQKEKIMAPDEQTAINMITRKHNMQCENVEIVYVEDAELIEPEPKEELLLEETKGETNEHKSEDEGEAVNV